MKWIVIVLVLVGMCIPATSTFAGSKLEDQLAKKAGEAIIRVGEKIFTNEGVTDKNDRREHKQQGERAEQADGIKRGQRKQQHENGIEEDWNKSDIRIREAEAKAAREANEKLLQSDIRIREAEAKAAREASKRPPVIRILRPQGERLPQAAQPQTSAPASQATTSRPSAPSQTKPAEEERVVVYETDTYRVVKKPQR